MLSRNLITLLTFCLTLLGTDTLKAQTCTGENGNCHGPIRFGEKLSLGTNGSNVITLINKQNNSYAATFYRNFIVNQEHGHVGYQSTLVKQIPHLLLCKMTIRSGSVACQFTGPLENERQNLAADLPAQLNSRSSQALLSLGGRLDIVQNGLTYFCTSQKVCFVQINSQAFPGGVF